MYSLNEIICLAAFTGLSFWTSSFLSVVVVGVFRSGRDSLPTAPKLIEIYLSRALALIVIFAGVVWLLIKVAGLPIYAFNDVSYVRISLLAAVSGAGSTIISTIFPNLFLQEHTKK